MLNIGYNGSKGGDLDIVRAPNHTATTVTTPNAQAFTYEDSLAYSRFNALVVNARKRHAEGHLAAGDVPVCALDRQCVVDWRRGVERRRCRTISGWIWKRAIRAFDVRHKLTGNWVMELPFGPNRAFLNKGGVMSKVLDGFSLSGDFTFAIGRVLHAAVLRRRRRRLRRAERIRCGRTACSRSRSTGAETSANCVQQGGVYGAGERLWHGVAELDSRGRDTVSIDASLSRTVPLGETRSFEARVTANNVFNTVQYTAIDTALNSATFGQVTRAAAMRALTVCRRGTGSDEQTVDGRE